MRNPDLRLRELERRADQGDRDAAKALEGELLRCGMEPRHLGVLDELLRETGRAGTYYANMLLMRVVEAYNTGRWQPKGTEREGAVPFDVYTLDPKLGIMGLNQEMFSIPPTRPRIYLNLPDGTGNPQLYYHDALTSSGGVTYWPRCGHTGVKEMPDGSTRWVCVGHYTTGLHLGVNATIHRGSWSGSLNVSSGSPSTWPMNAFVKHMVTRKLKPDWTDERFLRAAEHVYNEQLGRINAAAQTVLVRERLADWSDRVIKIQQDAGAIAGDTPQDTERRLQRARIEAHRDAVNYARQRFRIRAVPEGQREGLLTDEEAFQWNVVLDELHAELG